MRDHTDAHQTRTNEDHQTENTCKVYYRFLRGRMKWLMRVQRDRHTRYVGNSKYLLPVKKAQTSAYIWSNIYVSTNREWDLFEDEKAVDTHFAISLACHNWHLMEYIGWSQTRTRQRCRCMFVWRSLARPTLQRVFQLDNCCSLMTFFDFRLAPLTLRASGLRDCNDLFVRFTTSHRKIEQ